MKRAWKIASVAVALIVSLSMLAACSNPSPSVNPTSNPTVAPSVEPSASAAEASASAAETATPAPAVDSWLVDTTPRTIDWYVDSGDYNSTWDPNVCYAAKVLKEKTGITINFSFPVGGDAEEKLNTMIASDSLPDLIAVGQNSMQWPLLEQGKKLQPLNTLIDQYAPGFKKIMYKSMVDWCTFTDGNLYGFPSHFAPMEEIKDTGYLLSSGTGMIARKEIMDQLGITSDDFKTQDGMFNALMKVKNADLKYNGKDIIPLYVGYDVVDDLDWFTRESFGVPYENADGTFANKFHSPQYLEMMQYFAKCHNAGLMTDENFTGTYDTQIEKLASGQVFSIIGCIGDFGDGFSSLVSNDPNVNLVAVGPLMPSDGTALACHSSSMVGWLMTAIPVTTQKPERLLGLMNYIYSEEGKYLVTVGVKDETFTLDANGKANLKPEIKAEFDKDPTAAKLKWGFGGATTNEGVMWMEFDRVWGANHAPVPTDKWSVMFNNWFTLTKDCVFSQAPFQNCNPDPGTPEADIQAQVDNIRNEEMAKILLSKTPKDVETAWNAYVKKVDDLGYDKVLAAMNVKFQAHKKALGLTFAWPPNQK